MRIVAATCIFIASSSHAYLRPIFLPSYESAARGYTGITSPLLPALPEPARINLGEQSFLSDNVALLGWLPGHDTKISPADLQARRTGSLYTPRFGAQNAEIANAQELATALNTLGAGKLQTAQTSAGLLYLRKEVGFSFLYGDAQEAVVQKSDGTLFYSRYRDFRSQIGVGMPMFERPVSGRLDFGVLVKFAYRQGDEMALSPDALATTNPSVLEADTKKYGIAGGADLGFLYTLAQRPLGWRVQAGYSWKDLGTTQYFIGKHTQRGKRFEAYPNTHSVGIGLGSPLYFRYFRSALRFEAVDIGADIPTRDKYAASWELRFVEAISLYTALRGSTYSFGAQFRVPYFEILLAYAPIYSGKTADYERYKAWNFSMKAVF